MNPIAFLSLAASILFTVPVSQTPTPVSSALSPFDLEPIAIGTPGESVICGRVEPEGGGPGGRPAFRVQGQQYGVRIQQKAFIGPDTTLTWAWKKTAGKVCILQVGLQNPETGAVRYLGYGAGALAEAPSADPTVEVFVGDTLPSDWTTVTHRLADDIRIVLGWRTARITEVYLSPWDGEDGLFSGVALRGILPEDTRNREIASLTAIGKGFYLPPRLKHLNEPRELRFDTHFEELAPGRNSAANEWSAYGAPGDNAFNCMGRAMRVRYPAFDLAFRLYDGSREIMPDELDSFRLGLVHGNLPAIKGAWQYDELRYEVSVMAVPLDAKQAYDLYRMKISNPTGKPLQSRLVVCLDGPPDLLLDGDVVRGLGSTPFLIADPPQKTRLQTRDWGLCDKRAKSYVCGDGPGKTEPAVSTTRIGMDGLPVIYRFRAEPDRRYAVFLAASPHINPLLGHPEKVGDLVFRYEVEGAAPQTLDWVEYIGRKPQPLCAEFRGARDVDGDGSIQITASSATGSRLKHTRLSAIYVFPDSVRVDDAGAVYSGAMNGQCLSHIDVGATPECDWANQLYDMSDVGLCRLNMAYDGTVGPGETKVFWLKVPPIHRRQPVSMGNVSHAFLEVLPGEAVPPFGTEKAVKLRARDPRKDWQAGISFWDRFYDRAAHNETPDPVLTEIFLSRLSTRAIHDVRIANNVWFNTCSPWFYYDFAYRDQAYVVYAYDLAGLHDHAERLLRVYCMDVKDVPKGPIAFGGVPLQLGMQPNGLWLTRPGQYDAQGQNIWCMVEHYRLSGDRRWLETTAYPYIRRGAMWIVNAIRKHKEEVRNPNDPRYGLLPPGAMEVAAVTKGMHHYYMDAWAVLGLRESAEAARSLGKAKDAALFAREATDMRGCLLRSFRQTFRRTGLYEGQLWYGVELEGDGMFGPWGHTPLLWPTRTLAPHDPLLTGTYAMIDRMARQWGGGMYSDGPGSCWPYIGVDWAIGYILRGEPEKTLDYFCAFTDTAGLTYSWGEGYENARNVSAGDQPHFWADAQWISLFRHLFAMEDGDTLLLTPATLRRWQQSIKPIRLRRLPTAFGSLDLTIRALAGGSRIAYTFKLTPKGDQVNRRLEKVILCARTPDGRSVAGVRINGQPVSSYSGETVVISRPARSREYRVEWILASQ